MRVVYAVLDVRFFWISSSGEMMYSEHWSLICTRIFSFQMIQHCNISLHSFHMRVLQNIHFVHLRNSHKNAPLLSGDWTSWLWKLEHYVGEIWNWIFISWSFLGWYSSLLSERSIKLYKCWISYPISSWYPLLVRERFLNMHNSRQ